MKSQPFMQSDRNLVFLSDMKSTTTDEYEDDNDYSDGYDDDDGQDYDDSSYHTRTEQLWHQRNSPCYFKSQCRDNMSPHTMAQIGLFRGDLGSKTEYDEASKRKSRQWMLSSSQRRPTCPSDTRHSRSSDSERGVDMSSSQSRPTCPSDTRHSRSSDSERGVDMSSASQFSSSPVATRNSDVPSATATRCPFSRLGGLPACETPNGSSPRMSLTRQRSTTPDGSGNISQSSHTANSYSCQLNTTNFNRFSNASSRRIPHTPSYEDIASMTSGHFDSQPIDYATASVTNSRLVVPLANSAAAGILSNKWDAQLINNSAAASVLNDQRDGQMAHDATATVLNGQRDGQMANDATATVLNGQQYDQQANSASTENNVVNIDASNMSKDINSSETKNSSCQNLNKFEFHTGQNRQSMSSRKHRLHNTNKSNSEETSHEESTENRHSRRIFQWPLDRRRMGDKPFEKRSTRKKAQGNKKYSSLLYADMIHIKQVCKKTPNSSSTSSLNDIIPTENINRNSVAFDSTCIDDDHHIKITSEKMIVESNASLQADRCCETVYESNISHDLKGNQETGKEKISSSRETFQSSVESSNAVPKQVECISTSPLDSDNKSVAQPSFSSGSLSQSNSSYGDVVNSQKTTEVLKCPSCSHIDRTSPLVLGKKSKSKLVSSGHTSAAVKDPKRVTDLPMRIDKKLENNLKMASETDTVTGSDNKMATETDSVIECDYKPSSQKDNFEKPVSANSLTMRNDVEPVPAITHSVTEKDVKPIPATHLTTFHLKKPTSLLTYRRVNFLPDSKANDKANPVVADMPWFGKASKDPSWRISSFSARKATESRIDLSSSMALCHSRFSVLPKKGVGHCSSRPLTSMLLGSVPPPILGQINNSFTRSLHDVSHAVMPLAFSSFPTRQTNKHDDFTNEIACVSSYSHWSNHQSKHGVPSTSINQHVVMSDGKLPPFPTNLTGSRASRISSKSVQSCAINLQSNKLNKLQLNHSKEVLHDQSNNLSSHHSNTDQRSLSKNLQSDRSKVASTATMPTRSIQYASTSLHASTTEKAKTNLRLFSSSRTNSGVPASNAHRECCTGTGAAKFKTMPEESSDKMKSSGYQEGIDRIAEALLQPPADGLKEEVTTRHSQPNPISPDRQPRLQNQDASGKGPPSTPSSQLASWHKTANATRDFQPKFTRDEQSTATGQWNQGCWRPKSPKGRTVEHRKVRLYFFL